MDSDMDMPSVTGSSVMSGSGNGNGTPFGKPTFDNLSEDGSIDTTKIDADSKVQAAVDAAK